MKIANAHNFNLVPEFFLNGSFSAAYIVFFEKKIKTKFFF